VLARRCGPAQRKVTAVDVGCDHLGQVEVCRVRGELDAFTTSEFREWAARLCGSAKAVFDLGELTFMDSAGLGALIGAIRRIRETGGEVVLNSPRPLVTRMLRTAGIDRIVLMTGSIEEAVTHFLGAAVA